MIALTTRIAAFALLATLFASPLRAQEEEFDPREAIKKIQKELDQIVENLAELSSRKIDPEAGDRVVSDIDELLRDLSSSQAGVVQNIDEILAKMKSRESKNSSSNSSQSQSQSQSNSQSQSGSSSQSGSESGSRGGSKPQDRNAGGRRDRNEGNQGRKEGQGQPQGKKPGEEPGGKPESEGGKPQGGEGDPKGGENAQDNQQSNSGRKAPGSGSERVDPEFDRQGWGYLPSEVRQLLIEKNFRDYFPDYDREIADYLKSINKRP
ncbi:MAG: hypothetical protein R3F20_08245 [Planctomycetota bacterium]